MAKTLYVGETLTNEMIIAGKQLIQQIKKTIPITASFWLYTSESENWHLCITSPIVSKEGTRKIYDKIINIIKNDKKHEYTLPADCIFAIDDNDEYISSLRMIRLSHTIFDQRLTSAGVPGGRYIEDAYIYNLYPKTNDESSSSQSKI